MPMRRSILIAIATFSILCVAGWGLFQFHLHRQIHLWQQSLASGHHDQALRMARDLATTTAWKLRTAESAFRLRELDVARRYLHEVGPIPEAQWLHHIDAAWRWDWPSVDG